MKLLCFFPGTCEAVVNRAKPISSTNPRAEHELQEQSRWRLLQKADGHHHMASAVDTKSGCWGGNAKKISNLPDSQTDPCLWRCLRGLYFSFQPGSPKGNMTLRGEIRSHRLEPCSQLLETVAGKTHSTESLPVAEIPK